MATTLGVNPPFGTDAMWTKILAEAVLLFNVVPARRPHRLNRPSKR